MKKRLLPIIGVIMALICACASFASCTKLEGGIVTELPSDYEGMQETDKSAFALYNEAYANFLSNRAYKRTQYYDFESSMFDMKIKTVRKLDGEKIYNEEVVIGAGFLTLNEGKRFYYDGDKAYSIYFNDKKKVPGKGENDDLYTVKDWTEFSPYAPDADVLEEELSRYRSKLVLYDLSQKAYLAQDSSDKVYEKDGFFYFTLEVDSSDDALSAAQSAVAEAIAKKTGGKKEDLHMLQNTVIEACVEIVDGHARFRLIRTTEKFRGKIAIFTSDCKQQYYNRIDYGAQVNAITAEDLLNLAD